MAPQVQRPDPPYVQVVRHIRRQIESGELKSGDRIPSARQIASDWKISLATATKVLGALQAEGLATGIPGVGTVVTGYDLAPAPKQRVTSSKEGRIYRPDERAEILEAKLVDASSSIADALGIKAGAPALCRRRVTYRDETPVSASTSWFDGRLAEQAPQLLEPNRIRQGTPRYVEETTGRVMTRGRDQQAADAATEQDAQTLGIEIGSPVLRGRNWIYDADGDVIEYGEYVSAQGRWSSYEYEIPS